MNNQDFNLFIDAINNTKLVSVTFNSHEKGVITRKCVPFDFGPGKRIKDGLDRYHFLDLDSPEGKPHNLSVLPEQLIEIVILDEKFNPGKYVTWTPNWIITRDWGVYS